MKSFPDKIRICDTIINTIKILKMKLLHHFVLALFTIYHAYAHTQTGREGQPCDKKDDSGMFLFICLVVGFFIVKSQEDNRHDRSDANYDSDEDEEEVDSGDEADTEEEESDAEESEEETEQEEDDNNVEEDEDVDEAEDAEPVRRKSRRLGSKATLADSHS